MGGERRCVCTQLLIMQVKQCRDDAKFVIVSATKELNSCQAHQDIAGGIPGELESFEATPLKICPPHAVAKVTSVPLGHKSQN